jgi:hypothetical protein
MTITIALISVFKNESHILEEWIEHYLKEGINHFFLVDNGSSDNYLDKLKIYIDKQIVTLIRDEKKYSQVEHLNKFLPICRNFDWVMVVDLDEILYSRNGYRTIKDYLNSLNENIIQVNIPWKIFGSNNHIHQPSSVINNFIYRDDYNHIRDINCKSITRGKNVKYLNLHVAELNNKNGLIITSDGQENKVKTCFSNISNDILNNSSLHLNHYVCQSWEFFSSVKMTRGDATCQAVDKIRNENYFNAYNKNIILDEELKNKKY